MPDTTRLIQNELLAFVQCFVQQMPKDSLKQLVINSFSSTPKVIVDAHDQLCTLLKGKPSRGQAKIDKLADDIITMMSSSEFGSKRSEYTFCAVELNKLPFFAFCAPTKTAVDFSQNFEKIVDIQNQTAAGVAELLNRVEKLEEKVDNNKRPEPPVPPLFSHVLKKQKLSADRPQIENSSSEHFYDAATGVEVDNDKFKVVENRRKRFAPNRRPNFIKGTRESDHVKGGFKYFDAFVYRVHNDTTDNDLKEFIESEGVEMFDFEKQSNESAFTQSFRIRFQTDDYNKVMSPEFWPQGICVRKFYRPKGSMSQKRENLKTE